MHAKSTVKINRNMIRKLTRQAIVSLEQTGEAVHTDLVQSQTMPFGEDVKKDGKTVHPGGYMQNTQTFVDYKDSKRGSVSIVSSTPYARRMYFHPEYNFSKLENPNAGGKWFQPYIDGTRKEFVRKTFASLYKRNTGV